MTDFATFFVYLYEKQWLKFYYKRYTNLKKNSLIKIKKTLFSLLNKLLSK